MEQSSLLKRTPLYSEHQALGAKLVEFGGWEMPVQYSGIIDEHKAVRSAVGLFDVCHMGEFLASGSDAQRFLDHMVPNSVEKLAIGQAMYTQLCHENGGVVDDLLIYHSAEAEYFIVVNAGTTDKDWAWLQSHTQNYSNLSLKNISEETALIAVQGPKAIDLLQTLTTTNLSEITYYHFIDGAVSDIACRISRTGYTGEDGFELYHSAANAPALWRALLTAGAAFGARPAGLGARDTLRLEAGMCLYGHELNDEITPLEADLGWSVRLKKSADFIGKSALQLQKDSGLPRKRVGVVLQEKAIARAGSELYDGATKIGELTSGTLSITLGYPIGMGYAATAYAVPGTSVTVDVRGKRIPAEVIALPFYKHA